MGTNARRDHGPTGNELGRAVSRYPTPTAADSERTSKTMMGGNPTLIGSVGGQSTQPTGSLNPQWVAWLMGAPIHWTSIEPLSVEEFRAWLQMFRTDENSYRDSETPKSPPALPRHGTC